eukprot:UN3589
MSMGFYNGSHRHGPEIQRSCNRAEEKGPRYEYELNRSCLDALESDSAYALGSPLYFNLSAEAGDVILFNGSTFHAGITQDLSASPTRCASAGTVMRYLPRSRVTPGRLCIATAGLDGPRSSVLPIPCPYTLRSRSRPTSTVFRGRSRQSSGGPRRLRLQLQRAGWMRCLTPSSCGHILQDGGSWVCSRASSTRGTLRGSCRAP